MPQPDTSLLTAALTGYQHQLAEIDTRIAQIKKALGGWPAQAGATKGVATPQSKRGPMSAAGRKRIAAAQRKRWAAYRKGQKA